MDGVAFHIADVELSSLTPKAAISRLASVVSRLHP